MDRHDRDLDSLEWLYQYLPASKELRSTWRSLARNAQNYLAKMAHHGLPALLVSFVHARVAAALAASDFPAEKLPTADILTLGCHVGLENRMLRDLGAAKVLGVEQDPKLVQAGVNLGVVRADEIYLDDMERYLLKQQTVWDRILVLAPQTLDLDRVASLALPRLKAQGKLVVLAHHGTLYDLSPDAVPLSALEETMEAYVFENG